MFLKYKLSYLYTFHELSERGFVSPFYKSNQDLPLTMEKPDGKSITGKQLVTQKGVLAHTLYRWITFWPDKNWSGNTRYSVSSLSIFGFSFYWVDCDTVNKLQFQNCFWSSI